MRAQIIDKTGKKKGDIELPKSFSSEIRKDILLKVYEGVKTMQSYGAMEGAGAGYSASGILRHRRHVWKTTYGKGISRVPRKIMSRHGASFNWIGATVSSARGGRKPTAPTSRKNTFKKINKKELKLAFDSAFAGGEGRFVFDSGVLDLKTKDFIEVMKKVFDNDFAKVLKKKSVRAGRGKTRGRKYKSNAGLLFVVGSKEKMNRKGVDVVNVNDLVLGDLAPSGCVGRLVAYSENAVKEIAEVFEK